MLDDDDAAPGASDEPEEERAAGRSGLVGSISKLDDLELCGLIETDQADGGFGQAAYEELYRRYRDAAFVRALRGEHDPYRAEDIVSEAFTKTLEAMRRGLGPKESFAGYLFTAIRSETGRRSAVERASDLLDTSELDRLPGFVSEDPAEARSEREQLELAFNSLPERWRRLLWLVEVQGLTVLQAARQIGTSSAAAAKALQRAREALRAAYLQQYVDAARVGCEGFAEHLGALVRGGLGLRLRGPVLAHVANCEFCSAQVERLRNLNESLRSLLGPAVAGGTLVPMAAAPRGAETSEPDSAAAVFVERQRSTWQWWIAGAGAAVALLGLLLVLQPDEGPPIEPIAPQASESDGDSAGSSPLVTAAAENGAVERRFASNTGSTLPWEDDYTPFWVLIES